MEASDLPALLLRSQSLVAYDAALEFMKSYVAQIQANLRSDMVWLLEHDHAYTAGASVKPKDLINAGVRVYETDRGGQYTYHGPGQQIVYLLLDLNKVYRNKPDIRAFICDIGMWLTQSLKEIGINAFMDKHRIGIWLRHEGVEKKLVAIGLKVKRWITYHGIALNVTTEMSRFQKINPCGLHHSQCVSLQELGITVSKNDLETILLKQFTKIFPYHFVSADVQQFYMT